MSDNCGEDNHTTEMREDRNGHDQRLSRHGHQPTSDTSQLASTGLACQGEGHGPPGQVDSNSQAPQVFDPPEKYDYQSLHHHAGPTGVYSDWTFRPDPDRDDFIYTVHGLLREDPVSTGLTLDQVSYQQGYRSSFAPDYPPLRQESDLSAITASSGTVRSSTSYGVGDSESEISSWSVNSPSITRPGWGGSIQGQRDYSAFESTYEQDDWHVHSDIFLPESINLENAHKGSGTQGRNQMIDVNPKNTSDWRPDHGNERMNDTYGVDSSILDPRAVEDFDQFQASVDATRPGGGIEQVGDLGDQFFDDVANPTSSELDAPPMEGSAVAPITTMARGNRNQAQPTRGRPGSGPVTDFCEKCGAEFTGDNSSPQ